METLKVGVLGLGRGGMLLVDALQASSWCDLSAVASPRMERLERFADEHPGVATYDDFRSLIVESNLDVLFVAIPAYQRIKYLDLAVERNLPVWMLTPAARRFDEAVEIMKKFGRADCPIVVSRMWGFESALDSEAVGPDRLGRVFLACGKVMTCWSEDLDWRGDSHRAVGGVMLNRAYALIDTVVEVMGLPTTVHAAAAAVSRPGGHYAYDTEDTGVVTCQFGNGAIAVISACWTTGPQRWELELFGTDGSMCIDPGQVVLRERPSGSQLSCEARVPNRFLPQIDKFFSDLRSNSKLIRSTMRHHLNTMAVIQTAYLSARTDQPESPGTILEMHDVEEESVSS